MNKAFVRESEAGLDVDDDDGAPEGAALPAGTKNYMTPAGHARLVAELDHLRTVERPKVVETVSWAAGNGDRSENGDYIYGKKRLREIDRRMRFLMKRLDIAEVVDPAMQTNRDQVFFGARVTYADENGDEKTVRLVGVDEADLARGEVSWISPIARALHKAYEGDVVKLRTPAGVVDIEVLRIVYGAAGD
ncbi:MAG: transcription elongation factor GreB [Rhodospirillales bacterium]